MLKEPFPDDLSHRTFALGDYSAWLYGFRVAIDAEVIDRVIENPEKSPEHVSIVKKESLRQR